MYPRPTSFSQNMLFHKCPRCWYYKYVLKIPVVDDMSYADAGNVLHECMEEFHKGTITEIEPMKILFKKVWKGKGLEESFLKNRSDEWWLMVINGMQLDVKVSSTELKVFYPDIVGYIDALDTSTDEIRDWKSSKRRVENEEEYIHQLKLYSWLYLRKFGRIPKKATVHYLRYTGTKGELSFVPTEDDLLWVEQWHYAIRDKMDKIFAEKKVPDSGPCAMWCPYKNLDTTENDNVLSYDIYNLGHNIQIQGRIDNAINVVLSKKFSYELKNAFYMKKANRHARTTIEFWNPRKRQLPVGFLEGLKKTLYDYGKKFNKQVVINIKDMRPFDDTVVKMPEEFLNGVVLRDYQTEAVEAFIKNKVGILELGTGAGKTEIAIETVRRLGHKTLFIVDKIELLRQTKERMESALGIPIGQIGQSINDIQDITVATVQTLRKNIRNYASYLKTIRFVIFDETHKVAAKSYFDLSKYLLNTEYRLGISGTAYRDDGNDMMITSIVGGIKYDLSSSVLISRGWLVKPTIQFIKNYMTEEQIKLIDIVLKDGLINETEQYPVYYGGFISNNNIRNDIVRKLVLENEGKKILILTKLVAHGECLQSVIPGSQYLYGATSKKDRAEMFEQFSKGDLNVLVSTISIFAEGIDIPRLDVVINASANKGEVKTIQVLGRVLRKLEGKENAKYIDFEDPHQFFRVASLARKRAFRKEGHNIEVIEYGKI